MTTDIANSSVYNQKKNCVGEKLPWGTLEKNRRTTKQTQQLSGTLTNEQKRDGDEITAD